MAKGRSFTDLDGDTQSDGPTSDLPRARQDAEKFAQHLRELEDDARFHWAWGTIVDIRLTVEKTDRVSEAQRHAVTNIEAAVQRQADRREDTPSARRGGSRRYEGFK